MPDDRSKDLAKIHLAKKQLGLDDDAYRAFLRQVAGVDSAADLTAKGRRWVLAELRRRGATFGRPKRPRAGADRRALLSKVYAQLGNRTVEYAEGILQQMYGEAAPARLEWASPKQLRKVIAALAYDARRRLERSMGKERPDD